MNLNELDRSSYPSPVEPDLGNLTREGAVRKGTKVASIIQKALQAHGAKLPFDSKYLGLAAGQAYAEHAVATGLGIRPHNVTIIDRQFDPSVLERLRNEHPETEVVQSGMFSYLEDPSRTDFSVITALGIEYVLEGEATMRALIAKTPKLLVPGGFVCVFPYFGKDLKRVWTQQGFEEVHGYDGNASLLLYKFDTNSKKF